MSGPAGTPVVDVQPFLVDPLWNHLWRKGIRWPTVLAGFVVLSLLICLTAALHGDFWTHRGVSAIGPDLRSLFTDTRLDKGVPEVPLLQDYAAILLLVTIPSSAGIIWGQFQVIARVHSALFENGCLRLSRPTEWCRGVDSLNRRIARNGRFWYLRLAVSLALSFTLIYLSDWHGFFAFLRGPHDQIDGWAELASAHWWAALRPFHPASVGYGIVTGYGIYSVASEATVGVLYISFLLRTRRFASFQPNLANFDGYFGWGQVRLIAASLIAGLVTGTASTLALYIYLEPTLGLTGFAVAALLLVPVNLYILASGTLIYRSDIRAFKADRTRELDQMRPALAETMTADQQSLYTLISGEMERVVSLSNIPFRRRTAFAVITVSLLPLAAAVLGVIQSAQG